MATGPFEESLAAYAGLILSSAKFADDELELGGFHAQYVVGRKRHVYVAGLTSGEVLVAVTDVTATPTNVLTMLSGLAVQIMNAVADAAYVAEEPESARFPRSESKAFRKTP
jgi:predicted regulator of Ras-like GTPase activity (Roadblock/LC7/MglB family)